MKKQGAHEDLETSQITIEMSEPPEGWAMTRVGEIAEVVGGGTPKASDPENFSDEGYPWVTPADLGGFAGTYIQRGRRSLSEKGLRHSSAQLMPPGAVLMSSRAPIGYVAIAANEISTNQGFKSFVLHKDILPEYVFYWLKFLKPYLEQFGSGSTFAEISGSRAREIPIFIAPLAEQKRIVAKIAELLERVNATHERLARVPSILKRFRQAVLAAACSGRLTEDWRIQRIPESAASQTHTTSNADFPEIPQGWLWLKIDKLSSSLPRSIQSGPFGSNLLHSEFRDKGVLAIGIDNVMTGKYSTGRQHRISEEKYKELEKYKARPLDVLITVMATVGRCCVVPEDIETAIITKHVYRITPNQELVKPYYLMYSLLGDLTVQNQIQNQIIGQTRPGINGKILKAIAIPTPPISEQAEIVRRVDDLFKLADTVEKRVAVGTRVVEKATQVILTKAFRGELVPTEADLARGEGRSYEPAYELLARTKAIKNSSRSKMV